MSFFKVIPYTLIISTILNIVFAVLIYIDKTNERENKTLIISEFVENQKVIAANFNRLVLELSSRGTETVSVNNDINNETLHNLKETGKLFQFNEELYLNNVHEPKEMARILNGVSSELTP